MNDDERKEISKIASMMTTNLLAFTLFLIGSIVIGIFLVSQVARIVAFTIARFPPSLILWIVGGIWLIFWLAAYKRRRNHD